MTDAVVNFLVGNLLDLLSGNIDLIRGVDDEFKNLLEEVQRLKAFLDDASKFHGESSLWDQLEKDIQKIIHKAEDVIDKFLVQAKLHREKNKVGRFFDVNHLTFVRALAAEIKETHDKVKKLRQDHTDSFRPKPLLDIPKKAHQVTQKLRQDHTDSFRHKPLLDIPKKAHQVTQKGPLEDDEVVGFDEDANEVMNRLVEGVSESVDIIPVVGMAGLGKTTLARKICNDSKLSFEFFRIIWVNVGLEYKIKDIYLTILNFFTKHIEDHFNEDVDALAKTICGFMSEEGGRCLIVLDDVWVAEVVDAVKKVFPRNKKGHRIMLTTRDGYLATYANPDPHNLKLLTPSNSFELLEKRAFGNGNFPVELVELGKNIAQRCWGVPLATVLIAGLLRGLRNKSDWVRVENNVSKCLHNKDYDFALFIEMSYNRLPQEMQTCFLYCGIFPRGFDIPAWKLIRLWIAEGLIKPQQPYTLEDIAELHLNDLVHRNLVILLQKTADGRIKTCRLHDLLHEFCRTKAANKWLFQEIYTTADNSLPSIQNKDTCRRLCIQPSNLSDFLSTTPYAEHARSFCCFSSKQKPIDLSPNEIKLIHKAFPLMRVLDVESLKFLFSKDFNQLFHLRYIAISGEFKVLPPTFGKFWNLQTLILNTSTLEPTLEVKAEIWNLLQLRHLHSNIPAKLPSPTITTGKPSCLQTLSLVAPESCKKDVFAKACFLKKLSIRGQMAAFFESRGGISNLEELKCLEHLKLLNDVFYMNKTIHLPATFFRLVRTVNKLTLANTRFSWNEADKLGQLESLEVLKLKHNAFVGNSWKPEIGGFRQLQVLWIERSAELESWKASDYNFPMLSHLVLISCDKLNAVPLGLADLPNFQEMRLEKTSKAIESAKAIEERKTSKSIKFKLTISC